LGEEDVAVWVKDLNPKTQLPMQQVIGVGEVMHDDIEGMGLYHGKSKVIW
jgi:3-phytase